MMTFGTFECWKTKWSGGGANQKPSQAASVALFQNRLIPSKPECRSLVQMRFYISFKMA
jgi:hypothetical protein